MFLYEGYACPVCGKHFEKDDDVVVCPDCGAPHHRECWKTEGHCHFADTHGTPQQWTKEQVSKAERQPSGEQNICVNCGHENPTFSEFCSRCGRELQAHEWQAQTPPSSNEPFAPFGGYNEYRPFQAASPAFSDDEDIGGITAKEARFFLGQNVVYYVTKFRKISRSSVGFSWNWAAFLLTPYWLWYRKQRLAGTLVLLFEAAQTLFLSYFLYGYLGLSATWTVTEYTAKIDALLMNNSYLSWWMAAVLALSIISFLIRLLFGAFGNYFYYHTAKKRILKLRGLASPIALSASGGTSVAYAIIAYVALYLVSALANFMFL